MKIEIGESLISSYLSHVEGCRIVQTNWKKSGGYLQDQLNLDIVFNNKKQLKKLAEIFDGYSEFIYANDIADYISRLKL